MKIPKLPKFPKLKKIPKLPKLPDFSKLPKFSTLPLLSKFLKKKGDDDEFDDDFDDDFGAGPDSSPDSRPEPPKASDSGDGEEKPSEDSGDGEEKPSEDGGDGEEKPSEDAAPPDPVEDDDIDDGDIDFGDDDFDDDDDNDGAKDHRRHLMIAAAGAFVLLAGVAGGAGWWYFDTDDNAGGKPSAQAKDPARGPSVQMALPPKPGSLNQAGGLNQLSKSLSKGIMTPRAPGAGTSGAKPAAKGPVVKGPAPGQTASYARTIGEIGGHFGGKANPLGGSLNALGGEVQGKGSGIVVPAVTSVTLRTLPDNPGGKPLGATPDVRLIEKKEGLTGTLPIIGKDGALPWQVYSRPYEGEDEGMRVAIVIIGLGLSRAASMAAIGKLPPEITLALDPYANDLSDWLVRARLVGHEVMMTLPMESERFPVHDAGPYSLDTGLKKEENIKLKQAEERIIKMKKLITICLIAVMAMTGTASAIITTVDVVNAGSGQPG